MTQKSAAPLFARLLVERWERAVSLGKKESAESYLAFIKRERRSHPAYRIAYRQIVGQS